MWNQRVARFMHRRKNTMTSGLAAAAHIILGLAVLAPGCSTTKVPYSTVDRHDASTLRTDLDRPEPAMTRNDRAQPARTPPAAAEPADTDRRARAQDVQPTAEPIYTDPGAAWVVERLIDSVRAVGEDRASADAPLRISVTGIRNQSRAQPDEFDGMLDRLADLLSRAGRNDHFAFTADPAAPTDYTLKGAAYLLNAAGFDQWELYLSLAPTDHAWTVWSSDVPVRMLRASRPRSQQIFPLVQPR